MSSTQLLPARPAARRLLALIVSLLLASTACQPLLVPGAGLPAQPALPATPPPLPSKMAEQTPLPGHKPPADDPAVQRGAQGWLLRPCQSCHGAFAEGASGPALRSTPLSQEAFLLRVRNGGQVMRGYLAEEIGAGQIADLHAWLQSLPAEAPEPIPNAFGLSLPPAVRINRFAEDLAGLAALAFGPDGAFFVAAGGAAGGAVWQLFDRDADGRADGGELLAGDLPQPAALLWLTRQESPLLLVGGQGGIWAVAPGQGPRLLLDRLPGLEQFQVNGLALGTDGLLYVAQGPPWDGPAGGQKAQPGAVWRMDPAELLAGRARPELFVSGLRSAWGIAFSPSGAIYVVDSGLGWPYRPDVPDELNLLLGGGDYGWPKVWGQPPADSGTLPPMAEFAPGSGASGLLYVSGRLFTEYANDQLVALSGQAGTEFPGGPSLVRVEIVSDVEGYHGYVHEFAGGFRRPLALAEGPDGAIYVADAEAGAIYRLYR